MNTSPLTPADREVLEAAISAARRLHIPQIQEVGAALRTRAGNLYSAIHFESATGFATVCGEVAALSVMVAQGERDLDIIAAVALREDGGLWLLPPCGRCRELISEFNPTAWVILTRSPDHWQRDGWRDPVKVRIAELLPRKSHHLPSTP